MISDEIEKAIERLDQEDEINRLYDIPICCREGWEDCPHVVGNHVTRKERRNIGM